ncbi:AUGMIN subunit like [Actinidia chinensis var. chinensis]|uniref:AUGMIN subunit like n=1 Tax=Actinidia chinensis var. chinensis TaxID=1590841 RepID=A0A2R6RZ13_ACTCC|nr:AUGMIN subunit like [Actinidia chinensis var. chinensis]
MTMDREKEREIELESAMYTNCLLLGLDPSIIGIGTNNATPRVGLFRHSNPKLGEQLLYFILSSLRGPLQSAKDFDKVWPIFDSAQSRDFRKVVQSIISELESQGALPRSNSRVSSLATCCGPRFVELLWQLSLHALREVHRRTFAADVASNPLPASLTDVAFPHAATLLPVMKARIALERRRFLKNAETAVQRQAMWSNLAHEMTAEFRGLCAEEAYLQQELEKLHDLRNKVKLEGELWDELVSSSSQNSHLVQRATRLWDSLLVRKSQHEVLASGPIEDLIAHREHRYRISGSSLLAAMDQSSEIPYTDVLSVHPGNHLDDKEHPDGSNADVNREISNNGIDSSSTLNDDKFSGVDDRSGRVHPTVDIAEILRRWTHALQRIHKQSLQLAKANNGDGPELLRSAHDGSTSGHAESLAATLTEHQQHLASIQVLINQLKDVAPAIQNSIMELTEEVNGLSSNLPPVGQHHGRATSSIQAHSSGRTMESSNDEVADVTSRLSTVQLEKVSASPPALKLPPLFSVTPNSSGKGGNMQKRHTLAQTSQMENISERKSVDQPLSNNQIDNAPQDSDNSYVQNLKRSVREAALSMQSCNLKSSQDNRSDDSSEHFFVPLSATGFSRVLPDKKLGSVKSRLFASQDPSVENRTPDGHGQSKYNELSHVLNDLDSFQEYDRVKGFLSAAGSNYPVSDSQKSYYDMEEAHDQVFSPPLLMDTSLLGDSYEDLLAPLSETETALMER